MLHNGLAECIELWLLMRHGSGSLHQKWVGSWGSCGGSHTHSHGGSRGLNKEGVVGRGCRRAGVKQKGIGHFVCFYLIFKMSF